MSRRLPHNRRVLVLIDLGCRYVRLPGLSGLFSAHVEHPGGCYTCRYFGHRVGVAVWCGRPDGGHVRSQAERGCAFWEREPGADDVDITYTRLPAEFPKLSKTMD